MIIRKDLPVGVQLAQTVHAAGESVIFKLPPETHAVVLAARSEEELLLIEQRLLKAAIPHRSIREPDMNNCLTAIGLVPSKKTKEIKQVLSQLSLLK